MASAADIAQQPEGSVLRRSWRSFMMFAGAEEVPADWPFYLIASLVLSAAVIAALHVLEHYALRAGHGTTTQLLALLPAIALGVLLVVVLGALYWQMRLDQAKVGPYVVALLAFTIVAGVCIEALAGGTTIHLQGSSTTVGLWDAEKAFIWHVLDAIPLLGIPGTLGWEEPTLGPDRISGSFLLLFKLAVLVPLLRLGVSAYHTLETRALDERQQGWFAQRFGATIGSTDVLLAVPILALLAAGVCLGSLYLFNPSSWPTAQLDRLLPETVEARGISVPLDWATTVPQWVGVAAIGIVVVVAFAVAFLLEPRIRGIGHTAVLVLGYACILTLLTACTVAVLLALAHVGAVSIAPPIRADDQVGAAFAFVVRPVVDAVPGLDIPATVRWSAEERFRGGTAGALLLAYKLALFLVILFPLGRAIRRFVHDRSSRGAQGGALASAGRFAAAYVDARAALDAAEAEALRNLARNTPNRFGPTLRRAYVRARGLETASRPMRALFGEVVSGQAADVVLATNDRLRSIQQASSRFSVRRVDTAEVRASVEATRRAAEAAAHAYSEAAATALRAAAPDVG